MLIGTSNCALQYKAKAEVRLEMTQIEGSLFHGLHNPRMSSEEMHLNSWKQPTKTPIQPPTKFMQNTRLVSVNCSIGTKYF